MRRAFVGIDSVKLGWNTIDSIFSLRREWNL